MQEEEEVEVGRRLNKTEELREVVGTSRAASRHISTTLTRGLGKPTNQRIAANVSDQSELGIAANQSKAALYSHPQSDQSEQLHWNRSQ